jgi:transposase
MIELGRSSRIFVSTKPADMRKAFQALAALVVAEFGDDPLTGAVFLFISRDAKRAKVIWYDGTGFCLFQKRLSRGRFAAPWDHVLEGRVSLSRTQLALFFEGSPLVFMGTLSLKEVAPLKLTTNIEPIR